MTNVGDFRPYIHANDSDVRVIAVNSMSKDESTLTAAKAASQPQPDLSNPRQKSMIIGVTDISVLSKLESFGAAMFLASPTSLTSDGSTSLADPDAIYKGMRSRNCAYFLQLDRTRTQANAARRSSAIGIPTSMLASERVSTYTEYFNEWMESGSAKSALLSKHEITSDEHKKLVKKVKHMSSEDRVVLGDKLLRDNLRDLTVNYFKPTVDTGTSLEVTNMREVAIVRAELAHQKEQQVKYEEQLVLDRSFIPPVKEIIKIIRKSPEWLKTNVPLLILWSCYLLSAIVVVVLGIPPVFVIGAAFLIKIPTSTPRDFEILLRMYIPFFILYPTR